MHGGTVISIYCHVHNYIDKCTTRELFNKNNHLCGYQKSDRIPGCFSHKGSVGLFAIV